MCLRVYFKYTMDRLNGGKRKRCGWSTFKFVKPTQRAESEYIDIRMREDD